MKIEPTWDRIVVKKVPPKKSKGGILLPETEKKECEFGEVLAVGPGGFNMDGSRRPVDRIEVGDLVFFDQYHSTTFETTNVVIVDEEQVLAILRE